MVIVNVGHIPGSDALEKVVSATLRAVFPIVVRDVVERHELAGGGERRSRCRRGAWRRRSRR